MSSDHLNTNSKNRNLNLSTSATSVISLLAPGLRMMCFSVRNVELLFIDSVNILNLRRNLSASILLLSTWIRKIRSFIISGGSVATALLLLVPSVIVSVLGCKPICAFGATVLNMDLVVVRNSRVITVIFVNSFFNRLKFTVLTFQVLLLKLLFL